MVGTITWVLRTKPRSSGRSTGEVGVLWNPGVGQLTFGPVFQPTHLPSTYHLTGTNEHFAKIATQASNTLTVDMGVTSSNWKNQNQELNWSQVQVQKEWLGYHHTS